MDVKLVMFKQDGQRRNFDVKKETVTLGRNTDCDFQIPLAVISRRHTQLFTKGGKLFVRDLGSSNGTFVNNKRVQEAELHAGDTLVLGPVIFTIVINGEPKDIKAVRTVIAEGTSVTPVNTESEDGTVDADADDTGVHLAEDTPAQADPLSALESIAKKKKP